MNKSAAVHKIRIIAGILAGAVFLFYFIARGSFSVFSWYDYPLDFLGKCVTSVQIIPAFLGLLSGLVFPAVVLILLFLITLLFGRVYCSVLCPLGLFQDAGFFAGRLFRKSVRRMKGLRLLRAGAAAAAILLCITGLAGAVGFIDPYALSGKIAVYGFRPAAVWIHNQAGVFFDRMGFYLITPVANTTFFPALTSAALFSAGALFALAAFRGRLFCNTVCPVGAILGLVSRFSFYKIKITSACVSCGKCEKICRGGCIDVRSSAVDDSRCVRCFDCAAVCSAEAVGMHRPEKKIQAEKPGDGESSISRRAVLGIGAAAFLSHMIPKPLSADAGFFSFSRFPLPPGAVSRDRFMKNCTGCGVCSAKCPSGVIRPAFMEKGAGGFMQPLLDFGKGFCEYGCTVCSSACPTGALLKLSPQKKKNLSIGQSVFVQPRCIVQTNNTACGACAEVCPTHAVTMKPFKKGLTIPSVNDSICIGCGACEFQCPVRPARAIFVSGRDVQTDVTQAIEKDDSASAVKSKKKKKVIEKTENDFPF